MKREKTERQDGLLSLNLRAMRLVHSWDRRFFASNVLWVLFENLSPYLTLFLSAEVVNELAGDKRVSRLILLVAVTVAANLAAAVGAGLCKKWMDREWQLVLFAEHRAFLDFGFQMDYEHLGNPEVADRRKKINESKNINSFGLWSMLYSFRMICGNVVRILLSVGFSASLVAALAANAGRMKGAFLFPLVLLALFALSVFISMKNSKKLTKLGDDISQNMLNINRFSNGYPGAYQFGKDIRIFNIEPIMRRRNAESLQMHMDGNRKYWFGYRNTQIPNTFLVQGINLSIYAFVCLNALRGLLNIGDVVKYVGFLSMLFDALQNLADGLAMVKMNAPFLAHYISFFEIKNRMYGGTLPVEKRDDNEYELAFRDVSFRYPGSEDYALRHFSLSLRIGERLAVVGMNGSGKTTMIKLLCRLYDPTEGEITLNGIDIKKYDYNEYLSLFSVVFQDFSLLSLPLGQNVAASTEVDEARLANALEKAGFGERFASMEKGADTCLYKDFDGDGVEISGGEAQKLALARALYKDAPFVVLDEPTAALDPIAEYEIYSKFDGIVGSKTAVYISHRLSSCRFCHDIAVFDGGRLVQRGSHDALLADERGKYAALWHAQAQYYTEGAALMEKV